MPFQNKQESANKKCRRIGVATHRRRPPVIHRNCLDNGVIAHLCSELDAFCEINHLKSERLNLASNFSTEITAEGKVKITADVYGENKLYL